MFWPAQPQAAWVKLGVVNQRLRDTIEEDRSRRSLTQKKFVMKAQRVSTEAVGHWIVIPRLHWTGSAQETIVVAVGASGTGTQQAREEIANKPKTVARLIERLPPSSTVTAISI